MERETSRLTDQPSLMAVSQFAALEPSWARSRSRVQLRSLLVLGALFNRRLYVHDTQLADNPHLSSAFVTRNESHLNIFTLLTDLIRADVVSIGLRDGTYDANHDTLIACGSLSDLVASWDVRDPSSSWVVDPASHERRDMVRELDGLMHAHSDQVQVYPYRTIKYDFMRQVRDAFDQPGSNLKALVDRQDAGFAERYEGILGSEWFSHSTLFSLVQEAGLPLDHPLAQTHGVFDEAAYAHWRMARLLGSEWSGTTVTLPESILNDRAPDNVADWAPSRLAHDLSQHALEVVDGPAAELIGTLTAHEIVELRQSAGEFFDIQEVFVSSESDARLDLAKGLARASATYWDAISRHISRTRPHLVREPTRVAILLRDHAPTVNRIAQRFFSIGLSAITKLVMAVTPGVKEIDEQARSSVAQHVTLDFVFLHESKVMKQFRRDIPLRGWIAPDLRGGAGAAGAAASSSTSVSAQTPEKLNGQAANRRLRFLPAW